MSFKPKSLNQQLIEFAAKKLVGKAIDHAVNTGLKVHRNNRAFKTIKPINSTMNQERKTNNMTMFDDRRFDAPTTRNQARGRDTSYSQNEHIELWVNTVIVSEDGGEPIRLLTGRPLTSFNANRGVTTNNEELNEANATSNAFVNMMIEDARSLGLGDSKYYSPQGAQYSEEGPILKAGIYFQLHRSMVDPTADAAAKQDIEAQKKESLRKLFA